MNLRRFLKILATGLSAATAGILGSVLANGFTAPAFLSAWWIIGLVATVIATLVSVRLTAPKDGPLTKPVARPKLQEVQMVEAVAKALGAYSGTAEVSTKSRRFLWYHKSETKVRLDHHIGITQATDNGEEKNE